jgi:ankyrin repeat protein
VFRNKSDTEFLNAVDLKATTALQIACFGGNTEIVELLLRNGASISPVRGAIFSCLGNAILGGRLRTVELLLHYKADVHLTHANWLPPLGVALSMPCNAASVGVVSALIDHGANVYTGDSNHPNVLHLIQSNSRIQEDVKRDIEWLVKAEMSARDKCLAFAMAHHNRLGVASTPNVIDPEVLRMILMRV